MKLIIPTVVLIAFVAGVASAQAPAQKPAQTPTPTPAAKPPVKRPARPHAGTRIIVRDRSGSAVQGGHILVSRPPASTPTTDASGSVTVAALRDGVYRLHFERDGFITLERDVSIRNGLPA